MEPAHQRSLGSTLAVGDFDGKNGIDLAIGAIGTGVSPGRALAAYNFGTGLVSGSLRSHSSTLFGIPEKDADTFGASLAVGDFNGDGKDDLSTGGITTINGQSFAGSAGNGLGQL